MSRKVADKKLQDIIKDFSQALDDTINEIIDKKVAAKIGEKVSQEGLINAIKQFQSDVSERIPLATSKEIKEAKGLFEKLTGMMTEEEKRCRNIGFHEARDMAREIVQNDPAKTVKDVDKIAGDIITEVSEKPHLIKYTKMNIKQVQGRLDKASKSPASTFNSFTQWIKKHTSKRGKFNKSEMQEVGEHTDRCSAVIDNENLKGQSSDEIKSTMRASTDLNDNLSKLDSHIPNNQEGENLNKKLSSFKERVSSFISKAKRRLSGAEKPGQGWTQGGDYVRKAVEEADKKKEEKGVGYDEVKKLD